MTDGPVTVFVVDDDAAVRDAVSLLLEQDGLPVRTFASAEAFLSACGPQTRGCVIADLRMPGMDGLQLQQEMLRRGWPMPLIVLTAYGDIPSTVRALKAGAVDFLTKPVTGQQLLESVRAALEQERVLHLRAERAHDAAARLATLTERERDVMALSIAGLPNKLIGQRLGISHRTVEIHKGRVLHKTGALSVMELARIARDAAAPASAG